MKELQRKIKKDGEMMNTEMCFMKGDKKPIPGTEWTLRERERDGGREGGCYENI